LTFQQCLANCKAWAELGMGLQHHVDSLYTPVSVESSLPICLQTYNTCCSMLHKHNEPGMLRKGAGTLFRVMVHLCALGTSCINLVCAANEVVQGRHTIL
jgi:hypothetical protein